MKGSFFLRPAIEADIPALEELIPLSVRELQAATYSREQMEAALGPVFGVDRQLIRDGTYFVVVETGTSQIVGCGGWSRRKSSYGSDSARVGEDAALDPAHDPARIRAFFVHPQWARRGIGRLLLTHSEEAIRAAGFREAILVGTLAGEPLYAAAGYSVVERYDIVLVEGVKLPAVRMTKRLSGNT